MPSTPTTRPGAILITGCSSGIGRATAVRLASRGHKVYATARRLDSIAELEGHGCTTLPLDVCDEASMTAAVEEVERREDAVGVLVNNAGYAAEGAVEEVPIEELRRQFETNVFGLVRMCQLVLPGMRRRGWGRIINLSSMGGRMTLPASGAYHGTKYAVEALSDALRFEVRGFGIDVVLIEPGPIKTEFVNTAIAQIGALEQNGSPYSRFNQGVKELLRDADQGRMAALAGEPGTVARVIERAITARRPRTRYPITLMARTLMGLRRWLPDRGWDAFLRTMYPVP